MINRQACVPELSVSDINHSLSFYLDILLFKVDYQRPEDKFAMISLDDCQLMLEETNEHWKTGELVYPFGRGINFQIQVREIDELYQRIKEHQYPIKAEIQENWYRADHVAIGQKEFLIMDPDGYLLRFAKHLGIRKLEDNSVMKNLDEN
ncbi:bleomycin resistance protein [Peribacillus sp. NPDC097675]|uniref:bleomycin resistance protein n=1 Tax=Peribacillus sp. NPDC097675 TaxID=3390618 RepID=UPI003D0784DE